MCEFIYIKYADLTLKGNNKTSFINSLYNNIKNAFCNMKINIVKNFDNLKIYCNNSDVNYIISILKYMPGVLYIIKAVEINTDIEEIKKASLNFVSPNSTFKIEVKRKYKGFLDQIEIKKSVAGYLLSNVENLHVNVHNPNTYLWIEIKKNQSIIYSNKTKGIGGLPIGLNGSCLSLISGGIDSCVSSFLMQKKGMKVDYLTFVTSEVTQKTIKKIIGIINRIVLTGKIYKPKLYIVDFTAIQRELSHAKDVNYRITLMRRSFYRIAEKLAIKNNYDCLCSGDSLGQVASQTIESINAINNVLKNKIVFRPLLTYDKNEIINIAQYIHTYELSITNHEDICSMFAPEFPITRPSIDKAIKNESDLDLLEIMEDRTINNVKIFE
ncbi:tRNA uracil 4-sulfurtransferase ThiI [Malacoplasma muris]|uniref:tRNA uracil 4-sulfurtransferase ThiI n=1 Tax=Malacoplasma muris TaxID=2119 RepID=UPI00398E5DCD